MRIILIYFVIFSRVSHSFSNETLDFFKNMTEEALWDTFGFLEQRILHHNITYLHTKTSKNGKFFLENIIFD